MVGSGFPHPFGGVQLPFNWTQVALLKVHLIVSWRRRTDWTCWMELGQGTRRNLNAQRCTLSSIGFSVFSLCLYVLGFYKNPVVNKYSYFYGSHCLLRRVFVPATPFYQATSHMVRWLTLDRQQLYKCKSVVYKSTTILTYTDWLVNPCHGSK